jgi:hypothetical protein
MELPLLARLIAAALEQSSSQNEMGRERAEADKYRAMLDLVAASRSEKMGPVSGSLMHSRSPIVIPARTFSGGSLDDVPIGYDEGMVRLASKTAGIGTAIGSAVKGLSSMTAGLGRAASKPLLNVGNAATKPATPGLWSAKPPKPAFATPKTAPAGGANAPMAPTPASLPAASQKIQAPAAQPQATKPSLAQQSGLQGGAWKWKLPALGAAALGTYGAVRATKGVANIMSQEAPPANYNSGGLNPAYGVNAYGYPDRSTPFSY